MIYIPLNTSIFRNKPSQIYIYANFPPNHLKGIKNTLLYKREETEIKE